MLAWRPSVAGWAKVGGEEGRGGTFDGVRHGAASSRQGDELVVGGGSGQFWTHKVDGTDDAGGSGFPIGGVGWHNNSIWRWEDSIAYLCVMVSFDLFIMC